MAEEKKKAPACPAHYPAYRYHPKHGSTVVKDKDHEFEVAHPEKGWCESPADFPAAAPADPTVCVACGQKLPTTEDVAAPAKSPKKSTKAAE